MKAIGRLLTLGVLTLLSQVACAAAITISVGDNFYAPQTVTIHVGDVVTWQYQTGSASTHPTASDNAAWSTFIINAATPTKSLTFSTPGSFPYHCEFHGGPGIGMYGVITVAAALPVTPAQTLAPAFQAYPNPASQAITLVLDRSQVREHNALQLVDGLGRVVRTTEVAAAAAEHEFTISVADLPTGIYLYRLLANNEVVATQRLTLIH